MVAVTCISLKVGFVGGYYIWAHWVSDNREKKMTSSKVKPWWACCHTVLVVVAVVVDYIVNGCYFDEVDMGYSNYYCCYCCFHLHFDKVGWKKYNARIGIDVDLPLFLFVL